MSEQYPHNSDSDPSQQPYPQGVQSLPIRPPLPPPLPLPPPPLPLPPPPPAWNAINNPYAAQYYANSIPPTYFNPAQAPFNHGYSNNNNINHWPQAGSFFQQQYGYPPYPYYNPFQPFSQLGNFGTQAPATQQVHQLLQYAPQRAMGSHVQLPAAPQAQETEQQHMGNKTRGRKGKANAKTTNEAAMTPTTQPPTKTPKKTHRDKKIMLPAPKPTQDYLRQAAEEPFVIDPPDRVLVILDLNGTLIYRPEARKKPTHLIARPFLKPFLRYLFQNFSVMIWSSARPENVNVIVENVLDDELRSMLVGCLARDSFGLAPHQYNLNVQVYKDLTKIWAKEEIQRQIPDYEFGKRFDQHNTVLIDDTVLKASAQPHNLLLIPEFSGTEEDMKGDVLREVAGYLEVLKMQWDVSKFMRKDPFKADGRWTYDWEDDAAEGGALEHKISLKADK